MFESWRFNGTWHHYQQLALDALAADRAAGARQTLIVAPPGSGKTLIGLEAVRRIGEPALVLCPSQTIQRQWRDKQALFGAPSDGLHVLTYQALCRADDPQDLLRELAWHRWAHERAQATGSGDDEAELAAAKAWTGPAAQRRDAQIARIVAGLKRKAAAGGLRDVAADELLAAPARTRLEQLEAAGVQTVVLDECHHLASLWGALLAVILAELDPRHVIGLTATNPDELSAEQAALYHQLLDQVDFTIPTPAVVRDGHLAPYQELVQLCEPLASEQGWLDERHERFEELLLSLDDGPEQLGLSAWLLMRLRERRSTDGRQMSWAQLARNHPRLADVGLRWLHQVGEPAPAGAPRGEAQRAALSVDDWATLLGDYALGCLHASSDQAAADRLAQMQRALGDLGYSVTRQGVRRSDSDVDRVLLNSAAKPLALCEILVAEMDSRGIDLRAAVLCDSQSGPRQGDDSPLSLSGGGRGILRAVLSDERLDGLQPAMISAESFVVGASDIEWWTTRLAAEATSLTATLPEDGFTTIADGELAELRHQDSAFTSSLWTQMATRLLSRGDCHLLIGTRGLLGEGWDCPELNTLIDMTQVAAGVSVRQMRGRSLRLDPARVDKLASNWDVVCVAPALGRGRADYERFVRRHSHLHAPCEDGAIESGPSHVHPALSPYAPPDAGSFGAINAEQRHRAADLDGARERWGIGQPYRAVDLDVLAVRGTTTAAAHMRNEGLSAPRRHPWERSARLASLLTHGSRRRRSLFPVELPLDWAAGIVCDAYLALGELSEAAHTSTEIVARADGWLRVAMPSAAEQESARVIAALDELLQEAAAPRYLISRRSVGEAAQAARLDTIWYPVPSDLARRRGRADAFHVAWQHWCGPSELVYLRSAPERERPLAVSAWETSARRIWC